MAVVVTTAALWSAQATAQQVLNDLSSQPTGQVHFNSLTPKSRFELARRTYRPEPTPVWGTLTFPAGVSGAVPAMVIAHGSAGVQQKDIDRWVPFFHRLGIATFLVDSFKPRNISRSDENQAVLDQSANDADALSALKLLVTDPRIDPQRIGVIGFSRGGVVALETAIEPFRKGVISGATKFAAHVAFYPGCTVRYWSQPSPMTGAPVMMALAGKDNYTPPQSCVDYAGAMKAGGQDVEVHIYEGAYHDFDSVQPYFKNLSNAQSNRNCPSSEIDPVSWKRYKILKTGQEFDTYANFAKVFDYAGCVVRGAFAGSDAEAAKKAETDVASFLRRVFKL